jgi:hypothetical protein
MAMRLFFKIEAGGKLPAAVWYDLHTVFGDMQILAKKDTYSKPGKDHL